MTYTDEELATILRKMYDEGTSLEDKTTNVILFGIEYGKYIKDCISISNLAGLNLPSRIADGKRLALLLNDTLVAKSSKFQNRIRSSENSISLPFQVIYYGAPGTGKSYKIKGLVADGNHVRTTFHPDSDYASFVGAYKPTMVDIASRDVTGRVIKDNGQEVVEKKIVYEFVAQAFLQAYTEAWKRSVGKMTGRDGKLEDMAEGADAKYYLVIEEINRGNCAQIFGDLFQLLDRDDNGESSYAIRPDQDIKRFLDEQFKGIEKIPEAIRRGEEMKLPSNLYILATMNTSDQSLFPIDSAFKRRWDWEYVPIKDEKKGYYIKAGDTAYAWSDFLEKINEKILKATESDDKQMGYWFVHLPEGQKEISTDKFVGKVLFYLWNDVFKDFGDGEDTIFIGEKADGTNYELRFKDFFGDERDEHIRALMRHNKVEPTEIEDVAEEESDNDSDELEGDDLSDTTSTDQKVNRDTSKFSINGDGAYRKRNLPGEVIKRYIVLHPDMTSDEILNVWSEFGENLRPRPSNFLINQERFDTISDDAKRRLFELYIPYDGKYLYASNQYSLDSINAFIEALHNTDWGFNIQVIDE